MDAILTSSLQWLLSVLLPFIPFKRIQHHVYQMMLIRTSQIILLSPTDFASPAPPPPPHLVDHRTPLPVYPPSHKERIYEIISGKEIIGRQYFHCRLCTRNYFRLLYTVQWMKELQIKIYLCDFGLPYWDCSSIPVLPSSSSSVTFMGCNSQLNQQERSNCTTCIEEKQYDSILVTVRYSISNWKRYQLHVLEDKLTQCVQCKAVRVRSSIYNILPCVGVCMGIMLILLLWFLYRMFQ